MRERIRSNWNKVSRLGLREHENVLEYREVIFLNRMMALLPVIMLVYIPVEIIFNGVSMLPFVGLMIVLFLVPLILNYFRFFRAAQYYIFLVGNLFIFSMGLLVGKGINNHISLIPIVLLGCILFKTNTERTTGFLFSVFLYLFQQYLFEKITPGIFIAAETKETFTVIFFLLGMVLTFLLGFYFLKINHEYEGIILQQREAIELKNKEITDSISYARRIQSAILPSPKTVSGLLPESFILYKPKDIVAGDFYWLERSGDTVLFAAADCTGHGVPGAMVSVVCHNAMNRSIREFGLKNPAEILDKTREIVVSEFSKSEEDVKDGMDISLCALNTVTRKLSWAGANSPLWIVRGNEVQEVRADKQPIGRHEKPAPFTLQEFQLNKEDLIYIFTDGYKDQFGGEEGKKLKAAAVRSLVLSIINEPMKEQHRIFDQYFETWKGKLEQVDDVCVMGVRV